jgi:hypothetical protein
MALTRQELRWMLNMVTNDRDSSGYLKDLPGQKFAALHALEYENMAALAAKLERILDTNAKRVTVR